MKKLINILMTLLALAVLLVGVLFALRNQTPVALDFVLTSTPEWPVVIWLVLSLLLGVLIGSLLMLQGLVRARLGQRRAERKNQQPDGTPGKARREASRGL